MRKKVMQKVMRQVFKISLIAALFLLPYLKTGYTCIYINISSFIFFYMYISPRISGKEVRAQRKVNGFNGLRGKK